MRAILLIGLLAAPVQATEVIRLSEAEKNRVIAAAANGPERDPVLTPEQAERPSLLGRSLYPEFWADGSGAPPDRKVHGEVTMFAGSGGTFGMAGTALVPVGDTGGAAISIMRGTSNFGGISGFGFGYASDGSLMGGWNGLGAWNGMGRWNGLGGWNGFGGPALWGSPWQYGPYAGPHRGGRIR
jgi:hypothetical protein